MSFQSATFLVMMYLSFCSSLVTYFFHLVVADFSSLHLPVNLGGALPGRSTRHTVT